ncbi:MAG: DUF6057 family protein [Bacteroidales bacterium]
MQKSRNISERLTEYDVWLFVSIFFISSFIFFISAGSYILFFQEQQHLFIYLPDFLSKFLVKPGGLLELAGEFLTQFYFSTLTGSFILSLILSLPAVVLHFVNRRLKTGNLYSLVLLLIPPLALFLMQSHYYHTMTYNLGYLLVLLYFLFSVSSESWKVQVVTLAIYPLFYYITGAYAFIFGGLYIIYTLLYFKGNRKLYYSLIIVILTGALLVFLASKIFLFPLKQLLTYPLPSVNNPMHRYLTVFLTVFVILYPVFSYVPVSWKKMKPALYILRNAIPLVLYILAGVMLITRYNTDVARVINLEKLVFDEKWNEAVMYHEKNPTRNLIGQYFYNVSLTETDQLCERMFFCPQDFGVKSLFLPWDDEHLNWGSHVFYAIGLINEAHRWAYEELVVYGYRPQNLKMLVKTNLINGNLRIAEKYIGILKKTLFYKRWAEDYEKFIVDTVRIKTHPVLGKKKEIMPADNFFIFLNSPEDNLPLLVESNPSNRRAFEYLMAWLLLSKDVETVVMNIPKMKEFGYSKIPVHIEEAILIYYNSKRVMPDLGGLTISYATTERFRRYVAAYSELLQRSALTRERMEPEFGNSYWFYFHFLKIVK